MDIETWIKNWIHITNSFDTTKYLEQFETDAILDDPSVGRTFNGHEGIKKYFENYFIGYNTKTKIKNLNIIDENSAYLEVEFTGDFPEKIIDGTFKFTFKNNKISILKADLI